MNESLKLYPELKTSLLLTKVNNFLTEQGVKSYLVGGFVRDVLLGRDTADIDIAVAGDALEIDPKVATALSGKYVLLDEINRVGRVVINGGRWGLDLSTFGGSIEQDLAQRDFTIDAMAIDLSQLGGHYRIQGVFGLSVMTIGLFGLSRVTADTTHAYALTSAVVMGFGLGTSFPIYTTAIQNSVPQQFLGVATSSAQFFRSVGGSIGLALFGSYMVRQFKSEMQVNLPEEAFTAVPPQLLESISENPNALLSPEASESLLAAFAASGESGAALGAEVLDSIRESLANGIGDVFFLAFIFVLISVVAAAFIREIPLKGRAGMPGSRPPEPEPASADD